MGLTRRHLLLSASLLGISACARVTPRPEPPTPASLAPELEAWRQESLGMVSDGLTTLRTFDIFAAFRASTARGPDARSTAELLWDPPTSAAWNEATHVARSLHGRAASLLQTVASTTIDASQWREHRAAAAGAQALIGFGDALAAYQDQVAQLGPGDAAQALGLLDRAWAQWEAAAARWGISRSEAIGCGT